MDFPILCNNTKSEENDPEILSQSRRCANKVPPQTSIKTLLFWRTQEVCKMLHTDITVTIVFEIKNIKFNI